MNMGSSSGSDDLLSLNLGFPSTIGNTDVVELEPPTLSLSLFDFGGEKKTTTTTNNNNNNNNSNNNAIISCYEKETDTENSSSPVVISGGFHIINYYYLDNNNNNNNNNNKSRTSHLHQYSSPPSSVLTSLSAVNLNVNAKRERDDADFDFDFDFDVRSVSASKAVTVGSDVDQQQQEEDNMTSANHINKYNNGRVTGRGVRKKLRLSKDQSALLEEGFKHHTTLNPKQKLALANQLNLRPRQVEVWFQNRRARTKLKQTEVDCEFLRKCCETLTEENRRLEKELQELRSIKQIQLQQQSQANSLYMMINNNITNICPSCGPSPSSPFAPPNSHFFNPFASTTTTASQSAGTAC